LYLVRAYPLLMPIAITDDAALPGTRRVANVRES
jgi:hypothetical protein